MPGVHVIQPGFSFDATWNHPTQALASPTGVSFPTGISPRKVEPVGSRFHALLSAKGKRYQYRICKGWAMPQADRFVHSMKDRKLDLSAMMDAADRFVGTHDFAAFSANRGMGRMSPPSAPYGVRNGRIGAQSCNL